jgi:hypothetical protein
MAATLTGLRRPRDLLLSPPAHVGTRGRPPTLLPSGGGWARRVVATFARCTRRHRTIARGEAEAAATAMFQRGTGCSLHGRAHREDSAFSAVGWAVEISRLCDRSTGCEVAAEVLRGAQLPLELVEVNVLGCRRPRRTEACRQWNRGRWRGPE